MYRNLTILSFLQLRSCSRNCSTFFSDSFIQSGQLLQELGHVLGRDFYHCGVETVVLADSTGLFTCLLEGEGEVAEEKREG